MNIYIPHDEFYKVNNSDTLNYLHENGWFSPHKNQVTKDGEKKWIVFRYAGNEFREVLVHIDKEAIDNKHYVQFVPTGGLPVLSEQEQNIITKQFINSLPYIKFKIKEYK